MNLSPPADIAIRRFIYSLLDVEKAGVVVDVGCGSGYDLQEIAKLLPSETRLIGIDRATTTEKAKALTQVDARISFVAADIECGLPCESASADFVLCTNVVECVVDKNAFVREIHRVLRPGGHVICAHYDWDSQVVDGTDKDLVRRIVHGFSDCQQAWMNDCDAWMGRRLWRSFQQTGLFEGSVYARVLTETEFVPGTYGYETIRSFGTLVTRGILSRDDWDRFIADIEDLQARGEYFYGITMYVYCGRAV